MSATTVNIIISGVSVSGDIATHKTKVAIDLGNSDKIGRIEFTLQNSTGTYKSKLVSGNATVQADVIQNSVTTTVFRGTLETLTDEIDVKQGTLAHFVGYDYGQELLGLISPDGRQQSTKFSGDGFVSLTSGEQGMSSTLGMDLALYVSGVIGSGSTGYGIGATSGQPATSLSAFMSQYFGKSGDTTGSNSGTVLSFKPYLSGMVTSGVFPGSAYKTWYVQDGASDTNANYVITFDSLKAKHEYAWDVLRKLTRQGYVLDRSGFKTQFEVYIDVSGGINLITSGTSNFISSGVLVYYQAGQSGSNNNNVIDGRVPFDTTNLKNEIIGWFPIWTQYPFSDDYSDVVAYSGSYWAIISGNVGATLSLSGTIAAPGAPGLISIMGVGTNNSGRGAANLLLQFTLWSGVSLNVQRWNVSGGVGVKLNYAMQPSSTGSAGAIANGGYDRSVFIYDTSGNYLVKSGLNVASLQIGTNQIVQSGWASMSETIYNTDGTFNSGTGSDGGWAFGATVSVASGIPDLTRVKQIALGMNVLNGGGTLPNTMAYIVDNINFSFAFNFNPVVAFNSGSISVYGRRYEVFEFPYMVTDSGAGGVVLTELQAKGTRRMLAEFKIKDNPNVYPAQLNITPGQVFVVDAPSLNTGSGQSFFYWRAIDVKHEWSHQDGFVTYVKGYSWTSGGTAQSGQNLISYQLPLGIMPAPNVAQRMPNTHWYLAKGG